MIQYGSGGNISATLAGPFGSVGSPVKLAQVTLPAQGWKGAVSPYAQTAQVEGVSTGSKVDILLSPQQLEELRSADRAFTTENDGGQVTFYAIGSCPEADLVLQVAITEVSV